ncbi:hypothetical protein Bbelb_166200 [Branchiostoma belcheri]|nr:hypothetical protein Bbelb_166200 [Branchiostoma belcheri]
MEELDSTRRLFMVTPISTIFTACKGVWWRLGMTCKCLLATFPGRPVQLVRPDPPDTAALSCKPLRAPVVESKGGETSGGSSRRYFDVARRSLTSPAAYEDRPKAAPVSLGEPSGLPSADRVQDHPSVEQQVAGRGLRKSPGYACQLSRLSRTRNHTGAERTQGETTSSPTVVCESLSVSLTVQQIVVAIREEIPSPIHSNCCDCRWFSQVWKRAARIGTGGGS